MPIKLIVDVVCSAGLFFRASRSDPSWSVSCSGLDADGGVKGEANHGDVKGTVVVEVEASLPWQMCESDDVREGQVIVEV
jgi:hypothetical protein